MKAFFADRKNKGRDAVPCPRAPGGVSGPRAQGSGDEGLARDFGILGKEFVD